MRITLNLVPNYWLEYLVQNVSVKGGRIKTAICLSAYQQVRATSCTWICNTPQSAPHYLILASSTEGLRSGVSFLFRGLPVEVLDGDCAADITEGREAVVGGRSTAARALDCWLPRFAVRISWEDSDNWNGKYRLKYLSI